VEEAMLREAKGQILDHLGEEIVLYRGGVNRLTGIESSLVTSSIIVMDGEAKNRRFREPSLSNASLFQRDLFICAYCGDRFHGKDLTRDHIHPTSKGGRDVWMNVVTACRDCNALKGNLMPGQKLSHGRVGPQGTGYLDPIYVPYVPCPAENMIMRGRNVRFDQMKFLLSRVKNDKSRIFDYAGSLFQTDFRALS
jgi:hypothetical protein